MFNTVTQLAQIPEESILLQLNSPLGESDSHVGLITLLFNSCLCYSFSI